MGNMVVDELARIPMSPFLTATLARAADYATARGHAEVSVEHLLLALTEDPEASVVLKTSDVDMARLSSDVAEFIGRIEERQAGVAGGAVAISQELRRILEAAAAAAQQGRRREINGAIVLAAIVGDGKSAAAQVLRAQGLTFEAAIRALQRVAQAQSQKPAAPATASPQASADDILANARARVQTRSAPSLRELGEAPAPETTEIAGGPAGSGEDTLRAEPQASPLGGERRYGIGPAERDGRPDRVERQAGGLGQLSVEPETSVRQHPHASAAPEPDTAAGPGPGSTEDVSATLPDQTRAAPAPAQSLPSPPRPAPAPQPRARATGWTPAAPRQPQGPAPAAAARPGLRAPPPLPTTPGPLQVPGHVQPSFQGGQRPQAPPAARPSGVPWQEVADGAAPAAPPQAQPQSPQPRARQPQRGTITAGQLVHNIPQRMTVGVSLVCEARIGKAEVKAIVEGLQGGGAVVRHEVMVTKAMSVRLRSPDGGFFVEGSSPETQWIENVLGLPAEDFARWRWTITPREKGRKRLQLIVSARTVGADGLAAETAMPDQVIEVRVRTNYARSVKRWASWMVAAVVGGVLARFGETVFEAGRSLFGLFGGG